MDGRQITKMNLIEKLFSGPITAAVARQMAPLYNANVYNWLNVGQPVQLNDNGHTYIEDGYMATGAVYECVQLILKKITACPILVYEVKDAQRAKKAHNLIMSGSTEAQAQGMYLKAQSMEEVTIKELQDLIDNPNKYQDATEFMEQLAGFFLLNGNSYTYFQGPDLPGAKNPKWTEMHVLPAPLMSIISGGFLEPVKEYVLAWGDKDKPFPRENIAHMKSFNPEFSNTGSQLYGVSPLRAYLKVLARSKEGNKEINKQLANGGAFGIVSPKNPQDTFTPDQKQALRERLQQAKNSKNEVDRIMPGSVALDWLQIGLPISDMQLIDLLQVTDEDIYRAYGIPLQFRSQDASTYNNMQTANEMLIYNAVAPLANRISDLLTKAICEPYNRRTGKKTMIALDWSSLPELSKDMVKVAEWLSKCWDLTPNEKREVKGWGKIAKPEMDMIYAPAGLKTLEDVALGEAAFDKGINELLNSE